MTVEMTVDMSTQPSTRPLRLVGLVVAVLLCWLAMYPGTVASPYVAADSNRYHHQIVPETAAGYSETVAQAPTYKYSELSPVARTFVDRTLAAPDNEYTPTVCQKFVVACNAYTQDELPEVFTYGENLDRREASVVIRRGDEQFLLQTGMVNHGWVDFPGRLLTAWLTMVPLGIVIGVVAVTVKHPRVLGGAVGIGAVVAIGGAVAPYLEMAGIVQARTIGFLLLGGVWLGLLSLGGYKVAQRV